MKLPSISIHAVMAAVFIVAVDCAAIRSVRIRPEFLTGMFTLYGLVALPMSNVLAVVLSDMARARRASRPLWLGFAACGFLALIVTVLGLETLITALEESVEPTGFGKWLDRSPVRWMVLGYGVVPALLFFFQVAAASAGGWLIRGLATRAGAAPGVPTPRRSRAASVLLLMALLVVPALGIEGVLRWRVDPIMARHRVGAEAILDNHVGASSRITVVLPAGSRFSAPMPSTKMKDGWRVAFRDGSTFLLPNGSRVRIDDDSLPSELTSTMTPKGEQFGDQRAVRVTLVDGERTGESTCVPNQILRVIR